VKRSIFSAVKNDAMRLSAAFGSSRPITRGGILCDTHGFLEKKRIVCRTGATSTERFSLGNFGKNINVSTIKEVGKKKAFFAVLDPLQSKDYRENFSVCTVSAMSDAGYRSMPLWRKWQAAKPINTPLFGASIYISGAAISSGEAVCAVVKFQQYFYHEHHATLFRPPPSA
jgi:hypothetical protein